MCFRSSPRLAAVYTDGGRARALVDISADNLDYGPASSPIRAMLVAREPPTSLRSNSAILSLTLFYYILSIRRSSSSSTLSSSSSTMSRRRAACGSVIGGSGATLATRFGGIGCAWVLRTVMNGRRGGERTPRGRGVMSAYLLRTPKSCQNWHDSRPFAMRSMG